MKVSKTVFRKGSIDALQAAARSCCFPILHYPFECEQFIDALRRHGFDIVALTDLLEAAQSN